MGIEGISIEQGNSTQSTFRDNTNPSKYFTHFNVFFHLNVPCSIMGEKKIAADKVKAEIINHQFVPAKEEETIQEQIVIEKKILFDGEIDITIDFNCFKKRNKLYGVRRKLFFNHFIFVPLEISDEKTGSLQCTVEDVTYSQINRRKMKVTITLFVEYTENQEL